MSSAGHLYLSTDGITLTLKNLVFTGINKGRKAAGVYATNTAELIDYMVVGNAAKILRRGVCGYSEVDGCTFTKNVTISGGGGGVCDEYGRADRLHGRRECG